MDRTTIPLLLTLALLGWPTAVLGGDGMPGGAIQFVAGVECPGGWTSYSAAAGYFLVPWAATSSRIGSPVGQPTPSGTTEVAHYHHFNGSIDIDSKDWCASKATNSGLKAGKPGEESFLPSQLQDDDDTPNTAEQITGLPWRRERVCRKAGDADPEAPPPPSGMLTFVESSSCPAGWSVDSSHNGRFLVALPAGATSPGNFGAATPVSDSQTSVHHFHSLDMTLELEEQKPVLATGCSVKYAKAKTYSYHGETFYGVSRLNYLPLLLCRKD